MLTYLKLDILIPGIPHMLEYPWDVPGISLGEGYLS